MENRVPSLKFKQRPAGCTQVAGELHTLFAAQEQPKSPVVQVTQDPEVVSAALHVRSASQNGTVDRQGQAVQPTVVPPVPVFAVPELVWELVLDVPPD